MFEEEIKLFKNKYDLISGELSNLSQEFNENVRAQEDVKQLKISRRELKESKKYLILFPMSCLIALGIIYFCFTFLFPIPSMEFIQVLSLSGGSVFFLVIVYSIVMYCIAKQDYKKNATVENLELESNLEEIISNNINLVEKIKKIKEKAGMYESLINYFKEYNNKIGLLESVVKDEKNNLENLFNEYLEERVDYSKVHLTECVLPEKIKSLSNNKRD